MEEEISQVGELLRTLRSKVSELSENNLKISGFQKQITEDKLYLEKDVGADLSQANEDLAGIQEFLQDMTNKKMDVNDQYSYKMAIAEMLKDTGIKTKIIKQYLPVMNQLVNQFLQVLP